MRWRCRVICSPSAPTRLTKPETGWCRRSPGTPSAAPAVTTARSPIWTYPATGCPGSGWDRGQAPPDLRLLRLDRPLVSLHDEPARGFVVDFVAGSDTTAVYGSVTTGHARGVVTIDIAEADDAERERHRLDMIERDRTLLGHFRHESGHH